MTLIILQAGAEVDVMALLLKQGEKASVMVLLALLVWWLHRQNEDGKRKIEAMYEARLADLQKRVDEQTRHIDEQARRIEELERFYQKK